MGTVHSSPLSTDAPPTQAPSAAANKSAFSQVNPMGPPKPKAPATAPAGQAGGRRGKSRRNKNRKNKSKRNRKNKNRK